LFPTDGLTSKITGIESTVDKIFQSAANRDAVITFGTNGRHSTNSLHYSGNAIDLRTRDLSSSQTSDVTQQLRDSLGDSYDVINEGDHIHLEYDPPSMML
jgi:hypothetical protein